MIADLNLNFPFRNRVFDKVLARQVLEHLDDVDHAVIECSRVLRTGAVLRAIARANFLLCVWNMI